MSTAVPSPATLRADAESPVSTITHYQQLANQFLDALDNLVAILPRLKFAHPSTVDFVRSHLSYSLEFLDTTVAAVERSPQLAQLNKIDVSPGTRHTAVPQCIPRGRRPDQRGGQGSEIHDGFAQGPPDSRYAPDLRDRQGPCA